MMADGDRPRRDRRRGLISELQRDLRAAAAPNLLVLLWRWRWEVVTFLGLPTAITILILRLGWPLALAGMGIVAVTLALPEVRRWIVDHARCVSTAHRVRTGCTQARILTWSGRLPVILLTSPRPYGERVCIWCRAGICPEDFQEGSHVIRSACWATDIRVWSHPRYSHIVVLDIIRGQYREAHRGRRWA